MLPLLKISLICCSMSFMLSPSLWAIWDLDSCRDHTCQLALGVVQLSSNVLSLDRVSPNSRFAHIANRSQFFRHGKAHSEHHFQPLARSIGGTVSLVQLSSLRKVSWCVVLRSTIRFQLRQYLRILQTASSIKETDLSGLLDAPIVAAACPLVPA